VAAACTDGGAQRTLFDDQKQGKQEGTNVGDAVSASTRRYAGSRQGETMKRIVSTKKAAAMYNPVSQATVAQNGMLYTAGMVGRSPDTGDMLPSFDEQAHQALRNLGALLQEAGGGYRDVMFVQLYLLDMEKIERFNEIFRGYFPEEPPARAVCQPLRLYPGAEVMFTAVACISSATAS
jgi:2-iminobutanoate/2-iminopropanoate deaminase